jgi:hypothetical protein
MKRPSSKNPVAVRFAFVLLLAVAGCSAQEPSKTTPMAKKTAPVLERETWSLCSILDNRVGHAHTRVYREELGGQPVLRTEMLNDLDVQRVGQSVKMKVGFTSVEKPSGELIRFESFMDMGPQKILSTGRVVGNRLKIETVMQGKSTPSELEWSPEYGGFNAVEQSLLRKPMQPGERREFKAILLGFNLLASYELAAKDREKIKLSGETKELLRIDSTAVLPNGQKFQETLWTDRDGDAMKTHSDDLNIETVRVTKEEATRRDSGKLFDIIAATAVGLDRPIPNAHTTKKVRYRLHLFGENPIKAFPAGPTQLLESVDANVAEITVYSIRPGLKDGNPDAVADKPTEMDLRPNAMIQSGDPLVVSLADEAVGRETDAWKTAVLLEKFVHDYVKQKDFSQVLASAAETAKSREGDCTEHAVFLAALCRAKKIPARAVVGLVYVERLSAASVSPVFAYHMWVEAYIEGRWIPLDATLGLGGIGAEHLKVANVDLEDASMSSFLPVVQIVGRLKVEVLEVE